MCKQQEIDIEMIHSIKQQKKQRSKIIYQADKMYCGMEKQQVFKRVILPALLTICEQNNSNIVAVIQQIVDLISEQTV